MTVEFNVIGENGSLIAKVDGVRINSGDEVQAGTLVEFTAVPNEGYAVKEWRLNRELISGNTSHTFVALGCDAKTVTVEYKEHTGIPENNLILVKSLR